MTQLAESAGRVIASDITRVFNATDAVLLDSARLAASVLEGTQESGMHPRTKQKLLESMSLGYGKMLDARREMVQAHSQMVVIQRQSNIAPVGFGCWGEPEQFFTVGKISEQERPAAARA